MPSKNREKQEDADNEDKVVKNVNFEDSEKKSKKKKKHDEEEHDSDEDDIEDDDDVDEDEDDDDEDDDDEDEDDEDEDEDGNEDDDAEGLTDVGLYNVLGNFLVDEEGNSVGVSLSNIAKELNKLNHVLKKYVTKSS